jgi:hypothetical protein
VKYVASSKTIVLTPNSALANNATYNVTVTGGKDVAANRLDEKPKKSRARRW